jgi:hypothetical protein
VTDAAAGWSDDGRQYRAAAEQRTCLPPLESWTFDEPALPRRSRSIEHAIHLEHNRQDRDPGHGYRILSKQPPAATPRPVASQQPAALQKSNSATGGDRSGKECLPIRLCALRAAGADCPFRSRAKSSWLTDNRHVGGRPHGLGVGARRWSSTAGVILPRLLVCLGTGQNVVMLVRMRRVPVCGP